MINHNHYLAVVEHNNKMNRDIVKLNAIINSMKKDIEESNAMNLRQIKSSNDKFDISIKNILDFLNERKLVKNESEEYYEICSMLPMKL